MLAFYALTKLRIRIDLRDAIIALQILSNLSPAEVHVAADVDGGVVIGAQEAVFILQKVGLLR